MKMKEDKSKGFGKGKAIIGIALAAIMVASVMMAMVPTSIAVSKGGNFNYIGANVPTETVLVGQNVQFNDTAPNKWTNPSTVKVQKFVDGYWYDYDGPWSGGTAYNVAWDPALTLRATDGTDNTSLSVKSPTIPLKLKVGTKEVSSIAKGTPLIVDVGGINLFDQDGVKLVIMKGGSQIKTKDGQVFDPITVGLLKDTYGNASVGIDTTNYDVGSYTFQIKTDPAKACGLDAVSAVKNLEIIKGKIAIDAEKTFCVELQSVRLTVTGVPGDDINVASSPLSPNVIFRAGVDDTPVDATNQFNHTIDADGTRTYSVKFNDTGTFTIKVTVTSGPRYGEYDTVDITVSEKGVEFDVPSTVVIGEKLDIKGVANIGSYVDIFIDDVLYAKLNDLVIEVDGIFSKEVTTTEVGMTVPGSVRLKAWIDCATNPGDDPLTAPADGEAVILLVTPGLTAELSPAVVAPENNFTISGTAKGSMEVMILCVPPKGGGGNSLTEYGEKGITYRSAFVSTNGTFTKNLTVQKNATPGNYDIFVLSPGTDMVWDMTGEADLVVAIMLRYGIDITDPEDIGTKTQEQIKSILVDLVTAAGSDDLIWIGKLKVVSIFIFDTGNGTYPSIMGTHNGTIKPSCTINVSKLYTYPCPGTGGHTEYARIWNSTINATAIWNGYKGDWHNISFNDTFVLYENETYNYTIRTGSYPQIIHKTSFNATGGTITCTKFVDANGKTYTDWIPAIRLE
ncbi:MAG: hypothetical protein QMD80_04950 [archaeon]|nr:hypothetical protein [archaeon]